MVQHSRRRRGVRFVSAALVVGLLVPTVGFAALFRSACSGSLDTYRQLAAIRSELDPSHPSTPPPAAGTVETGLPPPVPVPRAQPVQELQRALGDALRGIGLAFRAFGHGSMSALLSVKQNDVVAYPLHITLARLVDAAHCSSDAVRIQWLKAGIHATTQPQVEFVAGALLGTVRGPEDRLALRESLLGFAERESWSPGIHGLRAVLIP